MTQPNDASRKSSRTFQCRDQLWETFEQMARELECSIDYLINEAMKQYARQRSYGGAQAGSSSGANPNANPNTNRTPFPGARDTGATEVGPRPPLPPTAPAVPLARPPAAVSAPPPIQSSSGGRLPPPPPPPPGGGRALPPPPARSSGPAVPPPITRAGVGPAGPPPIPRQPTSMPPQQMPAMSANPPMNVQAPTPPQQFLGALIAVYQGERTSVNKEKFIIGRGRQTSDLTIKDPNVSRQHAMIEFQNGTYYMVDLGSTNGVEFQGQRVTRKVIAEGDIFRICDHEVVFTYR